VSSTPTAINTAPLGSATAGGVTVGGGLALTAPAAAAAGTGIAGGAPVNAGSVVGSASGAVNVVSPAPQADEAKATGSFINFTRSLPSTHSSSGAFSIALGFIAVAVAGAASMAGTRFGRRLASISVRRGPTCLA
jgi:hypothetical protein